MTAPHNPSFTSFNGTMHRQWFSVCRRPFAARDALAQGTAGPVLIFDDATGRIAR